MTPSHPKRKAVVGVLGGCVCLFLGVLVGRYTFSSHPCEAHFERINPHLACQEGPAISKAAYFSFKESLKTYLKERMGRGSIADASVFFRDLANGPTFGINEEKKFISASLLKLPLAMTIYKLEEVTPGLLDREVQYQDPGQEYADWRQTFPTKEHAKPMTPYTVRELVRYSLVYSDNFATDALAAMLKTLNPNENLLIKTYRELGLIPPQSLNEGDISSQGYSSLFRLLYNASYLSREFSEELLGLLAESPFDDGLAKGLPKGVALANKFGERGGLPDGQKELHDCGIVYYPENPYLICVMTRGHDFYELIQTIGEISRRVYEEVDSRKVD